MADRSIKVILSAQITDFKRQMDEASKSAKKVGEDAEKSTTTASTALGRMTKSAIDNREAWDRTGTTLAGFGAATVAALGLATKAAIDWESAWAGVAKTVDGTDAELAQIEDGLRELARTLPASHQEIAATAEAAGQLGVATKDIVGFTKTMIDLSETTNLSADEAATSIAQLMNVMQTAPEDVDNLGASLVALGNNGASTERDIIQMAQRIAGSGKIIGLTEGEVMGLANALASVGIEVEAGGSAISNIMTDIAKSVSSGSEDLTQWARVAGMSATDFAAAWKADPADALASVIEGLGRMNAAGEDVFSTLSSLGQSDVRVSRALLSMANSGDLLRKSLALGNEAWADNTALIAEAEKRYDTAEAKLQVAKNSINDAAITLGETFLPAVAGAADAVAGFVNWLGSLPEPLQSLAGTLGATAGAASLVAGGFLLVFPRVVDTVKAFRDLQASSPGVVSAFGKVGKAVGAAAIALGVFEVAAALAGTGMDDLPGVSQVTKELISLGSAADAVTPNAEAARDSIEEMLTVAGSGGTKIQGLSDAIRAANMNGFLKALDWVGSVGGLFDKEFELGTEAVKTFDSALTSMAESGATQEVANALAYFDEQAIAAGVSVETARAGLDQYNEYLASTDVQQQLAGDSATGMASDLDALAASTQAVDEELQKWLEDVASTDASFIDAYGAYDTLVQKNKDAAQAMADATEASDDSWETFFDSFSVSTEEYLAELQRQVDAQSSWETNLLLLSGRVSQGVIDELYSMGAEGAPLVAQLVNASDEELARMEELFGQRSETATMNFATALTDAGPLIRTVAATLGNDAAVEIAGKLAAGTSTVEQIMAEYGITIEGLDPTVNVNADTDDATRELNSFIGTWNGKVISVSTAAVTYSASGGMPGGGTATRPPGRADGGQVFGVGTETSDSNLYRLSVNEHVISAAEVRGFGGHGAVAAMRAAARSGAFRGFRDGGTPAGMRYSTPAYASVAPQVTVQAPSSPGLTRADLDYLASRIGSEVLAGARDVSALTLSVAGRASQGMRQTEGVVR